ncbi:hypothetical protein [Desulfosoma caldarium]|uniref:Uncharacterized protein n=1 Tax=Desulfosoma caldarium TaxID=610254 RepID=A0A3N1UUU1_9BACT|nr:hypothetical protein [Desulfosoma caldarium]ROQ93438.1 hypothetical protein EDC27_1455 [Desulfosoma caldarium]
MTKRNSDFVFFIDGKPVDEDALGRRLPTGLTLDAPSMTYAQYFRALEEALQQNALEPLRRSLEVLTGMPVLAKWIRQVRIDSVKHGALYHVAKITVSLDGRNHTFVLNSAMHLHRQKALQREWHTLQSLVQTPVGPYVPQALYLGRGHWHDESAEARPFGFFLGRWFEGFHEWHMEKGPDGCGETVRVWDDSPKGTVLTPRQTAQLMEQAAYILTLALDRESYLQVYPWHHAAGDFVVAVDQDKVAVRLISARNRTVFMPPGSQDHERLSAVAAFFFMLSFRMRVDRHQGVGDLVWASAPWLRAVVRGFFRGWTDAALDQEPLTAQQIFTTFQSFDAEDWEAVGSVLQDHLVVDAEEAPLVLRHLEEHARDLEKALRAAPLE